MSYARAYTTCVIDSPAADGRITVLGIGRDWEASEPNDESFSFTGDVGADVGWHYIGQFEFIKRLRGIAPVGTWGAPSMSLSEWTQVRGKWREAPLSGNFKHRYLHYYDARANLYASGQYGTVLSNASYAPNLIFYVWRGASPQGETDPAMLQIVFRNGTGAQYALVFPAYREDGDFAGDALGRASQQTQPALWGRVPGETVWSQIATIDAGSTPRMGKVGEEPVFQVIRVEFLDGALIVRMDTGGDEWVYTGGWTDYAGREVSALDIGDGQIEVSAVGHTIAFAMESITYPTSAVLRPKGYFMTGATLGGVVPIAQTPSYYLNATTPAGTGISAAAEARPTVATDTRPAITFTSTGARRAILYNVQEYRYGTIGAAVSNPTSTADVTNFKLLSASGAMNDQWRGATMQARVADLSGAHSMADLRPNSKVTFTVSTDDGANYHPHFYGFTVPPEKERRGGEPGWVDGSFEAEDIITARLDKKQMLWTPSFEGNGTAAGWNVASAFTYLLRNAGASGVADAALDINTAVAALTMGDQYYLGSATQKGFRKLQFRPDTSLVSALDDIVTSRTIPSAATAGKRIPLRWGVDYNGKLFLGRSYEHQSGLYLRHNTERNYATPPTSDGQVLDAYTATPESWVQTFRSTRSVNDFRNLIYVLVGEGLDAAMKVLIDETSFSTAAARTFVGDLWTHFEAYPDGDDLHSLATGLWDQLVRWNWTVSFTLDDSPNLYPDDEVYVTGLTDLEIADGSIFKVQEKQWSVNEAGRYSQTVDCVMVEEGT